MGFFRRIAAIAATGVALALAACGPLSSPQIVRVTPIPATSAQTLADAVPPTEEVAPAPEQTATPLPYTISLPPGSAAAEIAATDVAMVPTPRTRVAFDSSPVELAFDEFYDGYNMRSGLILSDKLVSLDGQNVVMEGYMAPPLKPELDFFVLTRVRLAYCPFCSTAADWPDDIAVVYLTNEPVRTTVEPLRLEGRLEVGPAVDPETGMVSIVRIYADRVETQ